MCPSGASPSSTTSSSAGRRSKLALDGYVHRYHSPDDSEPELLREARTFLKDGKGLLAAMTRGWPSGRARSSAAVAPSYRPKPNSC